MFSCMQSIQLGKEEEKLLKLVGEEFKRSPGNGRFNPVIEMQYSSAKLDSNFFLVPDKAFCFDNLLPYKWLPFTCREMDS